MSNKQINRDIFNLRFINRKIFTENLFAVHMINETINLDKPIYFGFSVLEFSKEFMYDFQDGFLKAKYENDA